MLDKIEYLEDGDKKYPMAFTLNVMESLQERYGTLQDWGKLAQNNNEPNIKALKFMLTESINEGIEITCKCKENCTCEPISSKTLGRLIASVGMQTVAEKINKIITSSVIEGEPSKNVKTTENQRA